MPACIYRGTLLVWWDTRAASLQTNRRSNATTGREQTVLHAGSFSPPFLQGLAQIHAHSPDTLSHKGPCPAVTKQLPPPPISVIALLAQRERKKKMTAVNSISPSFKAQSEIHQKKSARFVFFLLCLYFFFILWLSNHRFDADVLKRTVWCLVLPTG